MVNRYPLNPGEGSLIVLRARGVSLAAFMVACEIILDTKWGSLQGSLRFCLQFFQILVSSLLVPIPNLLINFDNNFMPYSVINQFINLAIIHTFIIPKNMLVCSLGLGIKNCALFQRIK